MIQLNIGSDEEFNELQVALERSLHHELNLLEESDDPGMRSVASEHAASIKIIKVLLGRLKDLETRMSFKKSRGRNEEE